MKRNSLLFVLCFLVLTACDGNPEDSKNAGQVVARVNHGEISVHQVSFELATNPKYQGVEPDIAGKLALKQLVQQEVLVQKAMDLELDREPQVLRAIESAKRQVLANSYLRSIAANAPMPTSKEVEDFIEQYPELFSQRRLYQLQEIIIDKRTVDNEKLKEFLLSGPELEKITIWLNENQAKFRSAKIVKAAEQLPLNIAKTLAQTNTGDSKQFANKNAISLFYVLAFKSQPLPENEMFSNAQKYLQQKHRSEVATAKSKELHDLAAIEYFGAFRDMNALLDGQTIAGNSFQTETDNSGEDSGLAEGLRLD